MTRRYHCHPTCRDPRPPGPGVARKVADVLDRLGLEPGRMSAYLVDTLAVHRFADLCYSHASAILDGLTGSTLADDVARYPADPPLTVDCPRCSRPHVDHDGLGPPPCGYCGWCPHRSATGDRCDACGHVA